MNQITHFNPQGMDDLMRLGDVFAKSGMFQDAREANQAIVKIVAGAELGFGPMASMMGIYFVKGRVTVGANLMASRVKSTKGYDYKITWIPAEGGGDFGCTVTIYRNGDLVGESTFTHQDAINAGLAGGDNYRKYPRNMYFSRAISNAVRWYCPEVFNNVGVYTPDEMGAETNEDGELTKIPTVSVSPPPVPVQIQAVELIAPAQLDRLNTLGFAVYGREWVAKCAELVSTITRNATDDPAQLTAKKAGRLLQGLEEKAKELADQADKAEAAQLDPMELGV